MNASSTACRPESAIRCLKNWTLPLQKAIMSIGAVKGVEIGDGFASAQLSGSQNNDPSISGTGHCPAKSSNHAGGILGGISDGSRIILRAAIKPTPSISREQSTITRDGKNTTIAIRGRPRSGDRPQGCGGGRIHGRSGSCRRHDVQYVCPAFQPAGFLQELNRLYSYILKHPPPMNSRNREFVGTFSLPIPTK